MTSIYLALHDPVYRSKGVQWAQDGTILCGMAKSISSNINEKPLPKAIAMLDLDGTIIRPKNGRKLPRPGDSEDWEWAFPDMVKNIQKLAKKYRIIIISNQKRIQSCWKSKLEAIIQQLGIVLVIFAATADDEYRKPCTGISDILSSGNSWPPKGSFFCGDAAGRPGDYADTDRKFALNLGIPFYTPEEVFMKASPVKFTLKYPNISELFNSQSSYLRTLLMGWSDTVPTMHMLIGLPGCGKSWYARCFFEARGCFRANGDLMGGVPKSLKAATIVMASPKGIPDPDKNPIPIHLNHIVVDNTNLDSGTRSKWITLAKKYGYRVVCYNMETELDVCRHNIGFRCNIRNKNIPVHVLKILKAKYNEPTMKEGFDKILKVKFSPIGIPKEQMKYYNTYFF
jgi:bifunctional polynucleotide phosphatase/kinase